MENITIGQVITQINNAYKNVTLKQLLCMQGGIVDSNFSTKEEFWKLFTNNTKDLLSQRQILTNIVIGPNSPPPIFQYSYSNIGYAIAAHIVEVLFNTTYEKIMNNFFKSLGMNNAHMPTSYTPFNGGPQGNHSVGHSIDAIDKEKCCSFFTPFWIPMLEKTRKSPPGPPVTKIEGNLKAIVINNILAYPPPVISACGSVRLDMHSWLTYLKAVITHNKKFLPEERWNILLNTGMPQKSDKGQWYSYGWLRNPTAYPHQGFLFYSGYIFNFGADVVLKQYTFAVCSAANCGRALGPETNNSLLQQKMLEYELCPDKYTKVKSMLKANVQQQMGTTSPTGTAYLDPWLLKIKESFFSNINGFRMMYYHFYL